MTTTRSGSDLSLEKARILSAYETSWRQWRLFIAEQQDEHQRRHMESGAFADPLGVPLATSIAPVRANLPGDVRQELMRVLELRRQESQAAAEDAARTRGAPLPDRDTVFTQVLNHIADELAGSVHPAGRALVWHEGRLHEFNHRRVLGQTSDADYQAHLGGQSARQRRTLILAGIGAAIVVLSLVVVAINALSDSEVAGATAMRQAQVAGQPVLLWDVTQLGIDHHQWAVPFARAGYPLLLCAPPESRAAITPGVTLVLSGTTSVRTYHMQAAVDGEHDLIIADCAERPPVTIGTALLVGAATSTRLDQTHLQALTVTGPDIDPAAIPADRMQVALTVDAAVGDEGTLVLADGSRIAPSDTTPITGGVTLRYLVPLTTIPQPVGWEVSRPGTMPAILPLTLPAPQSRTQMLRTALKVQPGDVRIISDDGVPSATIALLLRNTTNQPLALRPADLTALQGDTVLPTPVWSATTLAPQAAVTIEVSIPVYIQGPPIELALAGWRGQLRWER